MSSESFDLLFKTHYKEIFHYCFHFVKNREAADELASESFVRAYTKKEKYDEIKSSFRTWIFTIARNLCIDFLRSASYCKSKHNISLDSKTLNIIDPQNPNEQVKNQQLLDFFYDCLELLRPDEKGAFILYYLKGFTFQEIAEILGKTSRSSVKYLIDKGKKILKECLESKGVDDSWCFED